MAMDGILTAALPGVTGVSLNRILWAYRTGRLPEPERLGCHRVHTAEDVQRIIDYFREVDEQREAARRRRASGTPPGTRRCKVAEGEVRNGEGPHA